jgi:ABC-2 type transport system ATP-binding protein
MHEPHRVRRSIGVVAQRSGVDVDLTGRENVILQGRLQGLREVQLEGRSLRARSADGARAVPVVLAALEAHAIGVASVTVARPSLDDVYLRFAGRSFAAAEATSSESPQEAHR